MLTTNAGGMGHLVIKDYNKVAILAQLKGWFSFANNTLWADLEYSQIPGLAYATLC